MEQRTASPMPVPRRQVVLTPMVALHGGVASRPFSPCPCGRLALRRAAVPHLRASRVHGCPSNETPPASAGAGGANWRLCQESPEILLAHADDRNLSAANAEISDHGWSARSDGRLDALSRSGCLNDDGRRGYDRKRDRVPRRVDSRKRVPSGADPTARNLGCDTSVPHETAGNLDEVVRACRRAQEHGDEASHISTSVFP